MIHAMLCHFLEKHDIAASSEKYENPILSKALNITSSVFAWSGQTAESFMRYAQCLSNLWSLYTIHNRNPQYKHTLLMLVKVIRKMTGASAQRKVEGYVRDSNMTKNRSDVFVTMCFTDSSVNMISTNV